MARLLRLHSRSLRSHGERLFVSQRLPACEHPRPIELTARAGLFCTERPVGLTMFVPCRKCKTCRRVRQHSWRKRMVLEINRAQKSWFVTFTFKPEARKKLFPGPEYEVNAKIALRQVAAYLKRLRAYVAGALPDTKLRFVAVTELHGDGFPHVHLLLHSDSGELTYRILRKGKWSHGFMDARLCDGAAASYLCKYVAKEAVRVRASIGYGRSEPQSSEGSQEARTEGPCSKGSLLRGRDLTSEETSVYERAYVMACEMPVADAIRVSAALTELEGSGSATKTKSSSTPDTFSHAPTGEAATAEPWPSHQADTSSAHAVASATATGASGAAVETQLSGANSGADKKTARSRKAPSGKTSRSGVTKRGKSHRA